MRKIGHRAIHIYDRHTAVPNGLQSLTRKCGALIVFAESKNKKELPHY
jgi:hypothetical protein